MTEQHLSSKVPVNTRVIFEQEETFENFLGQFQTLSNKVLSVANGTTLRIFDSLNAIPAEIRFDHKQKHGSITKYYFQAVENGTMYCVFGRDAARLFYPRLDKVDPIFDAEPSLNSGKLLANSSADILSLSRFNSEASESTFKNRPIIQRIITAKDDSSYKVSQNIPDPTSTLTIDLSQLPIIIIDKGNKITFPNHNYSVEVTTYFPE